MQMRRAWQPLAIAAAIVALPLFHSCKKDAFLDKRPIYDTIKWEKKDMPDLKIAKREAQSDSAKEDTSAALVVPLKFQSEVVQSKPVK